MITYVIIFVTVIVSITCFNNTVLFNKLSLFPYRVVKNKEWYRLLTHGFVHGDYMHLIINMLVFFSFGRYTEDYFKVLSQADMIGNPAFCYLLLYFGGMVVASIHDVVKNKNNPYYNSIGASGAVSAVIFTTIFFDPWGKIYFFGFIPIPGLLFGALYLIYSQYMNKRGGGNVNHLAHFYGAVYGFIFPLLMNPSLIYQFLSNF